MIFRSEACGVAEMFDDAFGADSIPELGKAHDVFGHAWSHTQGPMVFDVPFAGVVRETDAGIWSLRVTHSGGVELALNQDTAATLSNREGAALLQAPGCPYERAADLVAAVLGNSAFPMSDTSRTELEFDLARWIPLYFDL